MVIKIILRGGEDMRAFGKLFTFLLNIILTCSMSICTFASECSRSSIEIAVLGESVENMQNFMERLYKEGKFVGGEVIYKGSYKCKSELDGGKYAKEYDLTYRLIEPIEGSVGPMFPYDDESLRNFPITIVLFDANLSKEEWQETMLYYLRLVKNNNINGYIIFTPINCEQLYEEKGQIEADRILNLMSNFCCTYIENVVVAEEYKGCDGQCVGLVPATTKLMPYKYLDNIAYQFSSWLNSSGYSRLDSSGHSKRDSSSHSGLDYSDRSRRDPSGYSGRDYSDHSRQYSSSHHLRDYCIIA